MKKDNAYRLNVGLIIVNDSGRVLLCKRKDNHQWQFPQGGISKAETAISAAKREMFEEVGIKFQSTRILGETKTWYKYEVPKTKIKPLFKKRGIVGQKQKWFMLRLKNPIINVSFENNPDDEFNDYAWVSYWHPLSKIVSFKKDVYQKVLIELLSKYNKEFKNVG